MHLVRAMRRWRRHALAWHDERESRRLAHTSRIHQMSLSPYTPVKRAALSTWAVMAHTSRDSHLFLCSSVPVFLYSCVAAVGVTLL